jgi:hypothetical protein
MTKDFNRDPDQSNVEKRTENAHEKGRGQHVKPDSDPETAREREGEGFKGPADEYAETGAGGAGYRETSPSHGTKK